MHCLMSETLFYSSLEQIAAKRLSRIVKGSMQAIVRQFLFIYWLRVTVTAPDVNDQITTFRGRTPSFSTLWVPDPVEKCSQVDIMGSCSCDHYCIETNVYF